MIEGHDEEGQLHEGSASGVKRVLAVIDTRVLELLAEAQDAALATLGDAR